jgi:NADH-quinone oxidoreductase subunit C
VSKRALELLKERFPAAILETHSQFGDDTAIVDPASWRAVATFVRDDPRLAMNMFTDLCGAERLGGDGERFEVVLHVRSLQHAHRLRLKARVGERDLGDAETVEIDSLVPVWRGANWFERETYDMYGIVFKGHPDMRRILMYPEFVGHPLRKDYPANKTQPLIPYRPEAVGKLPPFGVDEGLSFGRQTHDFPRGEEEA